MTRSDYGEVADILQTIINPLCTKLQTLEEKVDRLNSGCATRTDVENLRKEISGSYVPRDAYEPRHLALVERQATLEEAIRELRKDFDESLKAVKEDVDERLNLQLSQKDRVWLRVSHWTGIVAIVLSVLGWVLQHMKFQ